MLVPAGEYAKVRARFSADLSALAPALAQAASVLFERISTPNWALEWGLPHWLGEMLDLPASSTRELLLSNVYMLASGRLIDDLVDGEDQPLGQYGVVLATVLYHLGTRQYVRLFHARPPDESGADAFASSGRSPVLAFWRYFDNCMAQWLQATSGDDPLSASHFRSYTEADFMRLAGRGAPVKICCTAACFLGTREDLIVPLIAALDQLLVAVVLLDDQFDWKADLEAGRHNAFVAYCSDLPQTEKWREANQQAVLEEIYLDGAARPYFDLMLDRLEKAERSAQSTGCKGLCNFITWYKAEVAKCGAWLAETSETRLHKAAMRFASLSSADYA